MAKTRTKKTESTTRNRKADDPEQYERFREFAREHEATDDTEAFDAQFRRIVQQKK